MPPSKIADFAGVAASADAAVMGDYTRAKQVALLAALMLTAQAKARDARLNPGPSPSRLHSARKTNDPDGIPSGIPS